MRHLLCTIACVLLLTLPGSTAGRSARDPVSIFLILDKWVASVNSHTPGRPDEAVATVAALTFQARTELNTGMGLFLTVLMSQKFSTHNDLERRIANLGRQVRENPGRTVFLKQAIVLHSDTGIFRDRFPEPVERATGVPPRRTKEMGGDLNSPIPMGARSEEPELPLLTRSRVILDKDGQILGDELLNWNWPFARSLLDLLSPPPTSTREPTLGSCRGAECLGSLSRSDAAMPANDPFPGAWYHATTAYMFANGLYGDATRHLHAAAEALPDDPRILFDRGCYAEILGLPMHQVLLGDAASLNRRGIELRIPGEQKTNAEAERLFRRALEVDPSFVEARVRLARLQDLRNLHEEAAAELTRALAAKPTRFVAFYAHVFAGRAMRALGKTDDAVRHYDEAIALFPDAQSALLGRSQAALLGSDVPGALAPVQRLSARSLVFEADPWWQYQLGAGRDEDALMQGVWAMVPR